MSVYSELVAAGVPIDNHESDLYVKVTDASREIVERLRKSEHLTVSTFISNIDGTQWFDIAFAYEPWWQNRQTQKPAVDVTTGG